MGFICWLDTGVADIDCFCLRVEAAAGLITRIDFRRKTPSNSSVGAPPPEAKSLLSAGLPVVAVPSADTPPGSTPTAELRTGNDSAGQATRQSALQTQFKEALTRWHTGDPQAFQTLPLAGAKTEFAGLVRQALLATHPGELITYQELARRAGRPKAVRAAASACARNTLPLVVPCHRVIPRSAKNPWQTGDFGNYSYGKTLKAALLAYETRPTEVADDHK